MGRWAGRETGRRAGWSLPSRIVLGGRRQGDADNAVHVARSRSILSYTEYLLYCVVSVSVSCSSMASCIILYEVIFYDGGCVGSVALVYSRTGGTAQGGHREGEGPARPPPRRVAKPPGRGQGGRPPRPGRRGQADHTKGGSCVLCVVIFLFFMLLLASNRANCLPSHKTPVSAAKRKEGKKEGSVTS